MKGKAYLTLTARRPSLTDCPDADSGCLVLRTFLLEWSETRCESFGLDTCVAPANIFLASPLGAVQKEALKMLKHPRVNY